MEASGNKKTGASTGCLEDRKGRSRLSRAICQEDGFKVCCHESERDFFFQEEEESDPGL